MTKSLGKINVVCASCGKDHLLHKRKYIPLPKPEDERPGIKTLSVSVCPFCGAEGYTEVEDFND